MLATTNDCVVSQVFFSNPQNKLLYNFTRHWSETDRPVITRVFLLTLLGNWDNICQLPGNCYLSRLPRPLKNNGEWSRSNIGQLFQHPVMNPIGPHRFMCLQLEQQVSNKFMVGWQFIIPQLWSSNKGLRESQDPWSVLMTEAKKVLNISALSTPLFVRWPTSSGNGPMLSLILC